jgi:predicted pyridoxine 5'-phosphate oxidase superfamily flavin-nucleotide-binding protein
MPKYTKVSENFTTIGSGYKQVAYVATPETLVATTTAFREVFIRPSASNTGAFVVVGGSTTSSTPVATPVGYYLRGSPEGITLKGTDLKDIYVAVAVNGDGVSYTYIN